MNVDSIKVVAFDLLMLAQDAQPGAGDAARGNPGPLLQLAVPLIFFAAMFYVIMIRPQQREQSERQKRLDALKKNDKVVTIGGIIGTIVDLSGDSKRITLRVDDGTRIKFTRASIQGLYDESEKSDDASTGK